MAVFNTVLSKSPVPHVTEEQFTCKPFVLLKPFHIGKFLGFSGFHFSEAGVYILKYILYWASTIGSYPTNKPVSRFHIEFNIGYTGAILSAVVLLFHKQIQLIQAVK